jgi:MFS family permease
LWQPERRGKAIAIYSLMPSIAPVVGPVVGSWVAEYSDWRWIFWSSTIFVAVIQALGILLMRETYPPVLLEHKADRIKKALLARAGDDKEAGVFGYHQGVAIKSVKTVFEGDKRKYACEVPEYLVTALIECLGGGRSLVMP